MVLSLHWGVKRCQEPFPDACIPSALPAHPEMFPDTFTSSAIHKLSEDVVIELASLIGGDEHRKGSSLLGITNPYGRKSIV